MACMVARVGRSRPVELRHARPRRKKCSQRAEADSLVTPQSNRLTSMAGPKVEESAQSYHKKDDSDSMGMGSDVLGVAVRQKVSVEGRSRDDLPPDRWRDSAVRKE